MALWLRRIPSVRETPPTTRLWTATSPPHSRSRVHVSELTRSKLYRSLIFARRRTHLVCFQTFGRGSWRLAPNLPLLPVRASPHNCDGALTVSGDRNEGIGDGWDWCDWASSGGSTSRAGACDPFVEQKSGRRCSRVGRSC